MSRKVERPISPRHIHLFDEDWEFLMSLYGPGSGSPVGVSNAIRTIVAAKCRALRAAIHARLDQPRAASGQVEEKEQMTDG